MYMRLEPPKQSYPFGKLVTRSSRKTNNVVNTGRRKKRHWMSR